MLTKTFTIQFPEGLHARPASELTKVCQKFKSEVVLEKSERTVNPKSIIGILSLGATKGDAITVTTEGEDEQEAMLAIEAFMHKTEI
ncbi:HPr family phosphocarrier protein [Vallitalea pronyensis]|uniref:Phosphocarrier protein HPr n=1 Tax=Vallitalea pronyensis TaxID=1348613 RepID=A0A8J8MMH4_9FIRM|nr:HPr family phosphocarrier protein [Vallitalea pronyensis]QUI24470.1 HPr family phosphocarrier protein [Vallitalea pronyensis]